MCENCDLSIFWVCRKVRCYGDKWWFASDDEYGSDYEIKYCPYCGRKLEVDNETRNQI